MVHQAEQVWQYAGIQYSLGLSIISCDYVTKSSQRRKLHIVYEKGEKIVGGGRRKSGESKRETERRKYGGKIESRSHIAFHQCTYHNLILIGRQQGDQLWNNTRLHNHLRQTAHYNNNLKQVHSTTLTSRTFGTINNGRIGSQTQTR